MVTREKNRGGLMVLQQLTENSRVFVAVMGKPHSWRPCDQLNRNNQPLRTLHPVLTYLTDSGIRLLFALDLSRPRTSIYAGSRYPLKGSPVVFNNFNGLTLYTKVPHEGVRLYQGDAAWLYCADCPIVLAYGDGALAVAHCGRDGLLNRKAETREALVESSVLHALVKSLGIAPSNIRVLARMGICPTHFKHPTHSGMYTQENERILAKANTLGKYCVRDTHYLALESIIRAQCEHIGIPRTQVEWISECPACEGNRESYWSHRMWLHSGNRGPDGMNGVFVAYLP